MRRIRESVLVLLLAGCLIFAASCDKVGKDDTPDADVFVSVLAGQNIETHVLSEASEETGELEVLFGISPDDVIYAVYTRHFTVESADSQYDKMLADFNELLNSEGFDGTVEESTSGILKRIVLSGDYTETDGTVGGTYSVVLQHNKAIVSITGLENTPETVATVDAIIEGMGFAD